MALGNTAAPALALADPYQYTFEAWPPGGYVEECLTLWGTRAGSGLFGSYSTVAWTQWTSSPGNCNNTLAVGAYRINVQAEGLTSPYVRICYNARWNTGNSSYQAIQATGCTGSYQSRHEASYYWPNYVFVTGGQAYIHP